MHIESQFRRGVATFWGERRREERGYYFFSEKLFWGELLHSRIRKPTLSLRFGYVFASFGERVRGFCFAGKLSESSSSVFVFAGVWALGGCCRLCRFRARPGDWSSCHLSCAVCGGAPPPQARGGLVCVWRSQEHFLQWSIRHVLCVVQAQFG